MLAAITTTLVLTIGFAFVIASMDREIVKANWDKERCNITTMFAASLYKPVDDKRSGGEFAMDNFKFCTEKLADQAIKAAFAPLFGVAGEQINAQNVVQGPMNNMRGMLKQVKDIWDSYIGKLFNRYVVASIGLLHVQTHLKYAMDRLGATILGLVYMIMSAVTLGNNLLKLIFLVVIIVIGILVGLVIVMFFVLFPFFPIILSTIAVLTAAGVAGAAGAAEAFCVDPAARVKLRDGTTKALGEIKLGDELYTGDDLAQNLVTGILCADCSDHDLVCIQGVMMSKSHRVLHEGSWILAGDHPLAQSIENKLDTLICLNTTAHSVPIVSIYGSILHVGDWEEFSDEEGKRKWQELIHHKLNGEKHKPSYYPTNVPLVSNSVKVYDKQQGLKPISQVSIGDFIKNDGKFTQVKAIYKGQIVVKEPQSPEWVSDGVWYHHQTVWKPNSSGVASPKPQPTPDSELTTIQGTFLVTEDETFTIYYNSNQILVRDFTEVGSNHLEKTYDMIDSYVNKK